MKIGILHNIGCCKKIIISKSGANLICKHIAKALLAKATTKALLYSLQSLCLEKYTVHLVGIKHRLQAVKTDGWTGYSSLNKSGKYKHEIKVISGIGKEAHVYSGTDFYRWNRP